MRVVFIDPLDRDQARRLGEQLGVVWKRPGERAPGTVCLDEFTAGLNVELEHLATIQVLVPRADSAKILRAAGMIALDHLAEIPDYYTRLLKMEREARGDG